MITERTEKIKSVKHEEFEKSKGFKITIVDLDTNETLIEKETKGIMGSLCEENGVQCFNVTKCGLKSIFTLIEGIDTLSVEAKKTVIKAFLENGGKKDE